MGSMYAAILAEKKAQIIPPLKKCSKCNSRLHYINDKWWCNKCMKADAQKNQTLLWKGGAGFEH